MEPLPAFASPLEGEAASASERVGGIITHLRC
jgi:hypothetical protein